MNNQTEKDEKAEVDQETKEKDLDKNTAHKLDQAEGEIGGPSGLEPTRYGDWERKGIISDF